MKKDLLTALKILKYSINYKSLVFCAAMFFGLGLIFELFFNTNSLSALSGIYMSLGGAYIYQMILTPTVSQLVSSSPFKRSFQTIVPAVLQFVTSLFTFTCFLLIRLFNIHKLQGSVEVLEAEAFEAQYTNLLIGIIITAFVYLVFGFYNAMGYKKMVISIICFFIIFYPILFLMPNNGIVFALLKFSLPVTIIISYGILVFAFAVTYIISLLLYRVPLDPATYKTALARSLK